MAEQVKEKIVYTVGAPWGLGKRVDGCMTTEEAIKKADLDWDVGLEAVTVRGFVLPEHKAVVRQTDHNVFAVVGNRYTPIQNRNCFKFFDDVLGAGAVQIETVGSLNGGRKIWILGNMKGNISILGDEIKKYILLTSSHDGTLARQIFWTDVRVVCENTLQLAIATAAEKFYTRHTLRAEEKMAQAADFLGLANRHYAIFQVEMEQMARKQLPAAARPLLLAAAFGTNGAIPAEEVYNPIKLQMDKVEELIEVDRAEFKPELHGTVYEAYNAVVKFTDYYRNYRGGKPDNRLNGVWFGGGNIIKNRARDWALDYTK
jgi:phage/plasmid-like protein (TIGR03299 family)